MDFSIWELFVGAAFLLHAALVPSIAGLLWLAVFFWWGSSWIRTSGRYHARYTFWVTIALLAALHFSLQLTAQIVYIHNVSEPEWLAILGFPNMRSLQKLQVLLPAALCCSVSFVQAAGLMVAQSGPAQPSVCDPLARLHLQSRVHLFASVTAISHTNAGVLTFVCLVTACASWPTTLNAVFLSVLIERIWAWSRVHASTQPPNPAPLMCARAAAALTAWTAAQLVCSYALQIPQVAHVIGPAALRALNIGIFARLSSGMQVGLMVAHATALALLYLVLIALRCACDSSTRSWPSVTEVVSSAQMQLGAEAAAREARVAEAQRAAAAHRAALSSPMVNRLASMEPHHHEAVRLAAQRDSSGGHTDLLHWDGSIPQPSEWMWSGGRPTFSIAGVAEPIAAQDRPGPSPGTGTATTATSVSVAPSPTPLCSLPALAGTFMHALQVTFRHPAALACALTAFAVSVPTGLSVVLLALAMLEMLARPRLRAKPLVMPRHALTATLMAWMMLLYLLEATGVATELPAAVQSCLTVTVPDLRAFGPLLPGYVTVLFLASISACAAHARTRAVPPLWSYLQTQVQLDAVFRPQIGRSAFPAERAPRQSGGDGGVAPPSDASAQPRRAQSRRRGAAQQSHVLSLLVALHTAGMLLVPIGWFSLGLLHVCASGVGYIVGPAALCAFAALFPARAHRGGGLPQTTGHWGMRTYAALHVLAAFAVFLAQPSVPAAVAESLTASARVSLRRDVSPVLAMFLLATAHATLGATLQAMLEDAQQSRRPSNAARSSVREEGQDAEQDSAEVSVPLLLPAQPSSRRSEQASPAVRRLAKTLQRRTKMAGSVSIQAGMQVVASAVLLAAVYALPTGAIGSAYIALAFIGLVMPNYSQQESVSAAPRTTWRQHHTQTVLLVVLFFAHANAQYLLTAGLLPISTRSCNTLRRLMGLQCGAEAASHLLSIGVPLALLACLACQRFLCRLGAHADACRRTLDSARMPPLLAETALAAFPRRWCIRHHDKVVLAACCALCITAPSAAGVLLLCGAVAAMLWLGGPHGARPRRSQLVVRLCKVATSVLVGAWALVQYGACMHGIASTASSRSARGPYTFWLGTYTCQTEPAETSMHTQVLLKGAVLLTIWLHSQSTLWCSALPDQLKAAGPPGTHCVLFWPPVGTVLSMPSGEVPSILTRMRKHAHRLMLSFTSAAMNGMPSWRGQRDGDRISGGSKTGAHVGDSRASDKHGWSALFAPLISAAAAMGRVCARVCHRSFAMLTILSATVRWLIEDFTNVCGHEALLLLLVTMSLVSLGALSLVYIAAAGYGMFQREASATRLPRVLVPVASCTLLAQYACFVLRATGSAAAPPHGPVFAWLGLEPTGTTLTLLLLTLSIAAALVHSAAWRRHVRADVPREGESVADSAGASVEEPLLPAARPAHTVYHLVRRLPTQPPGTAVLLEPGPVHAVEPAEGTAAPAAAKLTCKPHWRRARGASVHARSAWRWPDHLRFWFFRFSLDALMILVVALCCVQRDLIHAAYLALTLFLFRRREELRLRGNGLFVWMPLANYCFIVLLLLFQVPWGAFFGAARLIERTPPGEHALERCTLAHLLGLHRINHAGLLGALALQPHGSGLPLLMWLAMQVQSRLLDEQAFRDTVAVLQASQARLRTHMRARLAARLDANMQRCLALSRARAARQRRVERLKRNLQHKRGFIGADPKLMLHEAVLLSPRPGHGGAVAQGADYGPSIDTQGSASFVSNLRPASQADIPDAVGVAKPEGASGPSTPGEPTAALVRIRSMDGDTMRGAGRTDSTAVDSAISLPGLLLDDPDDPMLGSYATKVLASVIATLSYYAVHVHLVFGLVFVCDLTLASAVYPVGSLLYALVTTPHGAFWKALLIYTEALLLLQYVFQVALRAGCLALQHQGLSIAHRFGLHDSALRSSPLFLCYLVLLMHNYFLSLVSPRPGTSSERSQLGQRSGMTRARPLSAAVSMACSGALGGAVALARYLHALASGCSIEPHCLLLHVTEKSPGALEQEAMQERLTAALNSALEALSQVDLVLAATEHCEADASAAIWHALARADDSVQEALLLAEPEVAMLAASRAQGVDLGAVAPLSVAFYGVVAGLRKESKSVLFEVGCHPAVLRHRWQLDACPWWLRWAALHGACLRRPAALKPAMLAKHATKRLLAIPECREQPAEPPSGSQAVDRSASSAGPMLRAQASNSTQLTAGSEHPLSRPPQRHGSSSSIHHSRRDSRASSVAGFTFDQASHKSASLYAAQHDVPRKHSTAGAGQSAPATTLPAQRTAVPASDPTEEFGASAAPHQQAVSRTASSASVQPDAGQLPMAAELGESEPDSFGAGVPPHDDAAGVRALEHDSLVSQLYVHKDVEWQSRPIGDWFTPTLALSVAAFIYFAFFCQRVITDSSSVDVLRTGRTLPAADLLVLIILFVNITLDRICYSVGSNCGKALLLLIEVPMYLAGAWFLCWNPDSTTADRLHLRVFMMLRLGAMALSAVQVRTGYPTVRDSMILGNGQGRHSFYFYRHVDIPHWVAFQVFRGVPFLYELKALLDWSVTPTTLTLVDWLKLEDIRASLYNRQCDLLMRGLGRREGQAQPALPKFLLGFSLFVAILALLWTPLLAFSSSNPTFRTPRIVDFAFNASLLHAAGGHGAVTSMHLPVFQSSVQHSVGPWLRNATAEASALPKSLTAYAPDQLRLLCAGTTADRVWEPAPQVRASFEELLDREARRGGAGEASHVWLEVGFSALRSFPPATAYGGPMCDGAVRVRLSRGSVHQLAQVLQRNASWAALEGWQAGAAGPGGGAPARRGLFDWVWQLKEHKCIVQPSAAAVDAAAPAGATPMDAWPNFQVGCELGLAHSSAGEWWRMRCMSLDAQGRPLATSTAPSAASGVQQPRPPQPAPVRSQVHVSCPGFAAPSTPDASAHWGPPLVVAAVERVQTGFIGETLSSMGITGLYVTLVFGLGRFLRMGLTNIRMRIPYQDLPSVDRLTTLCNDIAVAREERELLLEEHLFYSLLNIYRSPAVLFEVTKKDS